jgi:hypothetical protein
MRKLVLGFLPGIGMTIFTIFVWPIAVDQGYFRHNVYILPVLLALVVVCWLLPLLLNYRALRLLLFVENRWGAKHPKMTFLAVVCIGGIIGASIAGGGWLVFQKHKEHVGELFFREQTPAPKPGDPFRAEVRSVMFYDNTNPLSLFMVGYPSANGQNTSPVFYLMHIQIVNMQNITSTIVEYSVAASDNVNGPWENLVPISLMSTNLYALGITKPGSGKVGIPQGAYRLATAMKPEDMRHAALLDPNPKLEAELGKPIQPHHTISGWAAFDSKRRSAARRNYFRISVRDSADVSFSGIAPLHVRKKTDTEADTRVGLIDKVGIISDISGFHIRYFSD